MPAPHSHCHRCGSPYPSLQGWPRECVRCGNQHWDNPLPVTLLLQPVRAPQGLGLLALRRGIQPQIGLLGLPGGFLEAHESWQEGMARELWEEAGLRVEAGQLRLVDLMSSTPVPNRLLIFGAAPEIGLAELPPFEISAECTERGLLFGPRGLPELMAFPLHTAAILRWYEQQGLDGEANWSPC